MNTKRNRYIYIGILLIVGIFLFMPHAMAEYLDYNNLCSDEGVRSTMRILGYVVMIIRWIAPLIIIIMGMIDFGKAVISSDDNAINKASKTLIRRIVAGIAIFFIPTIVLTILNITVSGVDIETGATYKTTIGESTEFGACTKCLFDVDSCS